MLALLKLQHSSKSLIVLSGSSDPCDRYGRLGLLNVVSCCGRSPWCRCRRRAQARSRCECSGCVRRSADISMRCDELSSRAVSGGYRKPNARDPVPHHCDLESCLGQPVDRNQSNQRLSAGEIHEKRRIHGQILPYVSQVTKNVNASRASSRCRGGNSSHLAPWTQTVTLTDSMPHRHLRLPPSPPPPECAIRMRSRGAPARVFCSMVTSSRATKPSLGVTIV